jgi:ATP-dependent DNA helicase PIF1
MTGCAALLLKANARTLHSWSGIKLAKGPSDQIISSVMLRSKKALKAWRSTKILIIDEVSMLSQKIFDIIEQLGRYTHPQNSTSPFGGIQVVFTGDFYQLPPVGSSGEQETSNFCFESEKWSSVFAPENQIELTTMFRQSDPLYINILLQIRRGELDEAGKRILQNYVSREYDPAAHNGCVPTKLFPTRAKAEFVNAAMFAKLESKEFVFDFAKKTNCKTYLENSKAIPQDILTMAQRLTKAEIDYEIEQLAANIPGSRTLSLKKGAVVMCTVNVDLENGICNGSQGIVIDMLERGPTSAPIPIVKFSNGLTRPMEVHYWQSEEHPTIAIGQYPLCLAWAMTIHKIQGATMTLAEIDIGAAVFEYGQTYVALSRIQSLDGLYLSGFHAQKIKANPKVSEFYKQIPQIDYDSELLKLCSTKHTDFGSSHTPSTGGNPSRSNITFDLFLQGKTIQEISVIRGIKENTVYEHIISNMPHEQVTMDRFMSQDEYTEIEKACILFGKESLLKPIKDSINPDICYEKIKLVKKMIFGEHNVTSIELQEPVAKVSIEENPFNVFRMVCSEQDKTDPTVKRIII